MQFSALIQRFPQSRNLASSTLAACLCLFPVLAVVSTVSLAEETPPVKVASRVAAQGDKPAIDSLPETVGFNKYIRPILTKNCVGCHGGPKQAAGVSFLYRESALAESESGVAPIVAGDPEASYLMDRISDPDEEFRMPPADHGPRLSEREVALMRKWIEQGANWEEHWSFIAPTKHEAPEVNRPEWIRKKIDAFVLAKIEKAGKQPAPAADRATWLRRVSFDLIGLPPTADEINDFLMDNRPGAFERVVNRLLASPHFGERWTSVWLDLARYADTKGYEKDPHRDIWPYRDWLIRAFNEDMPYDEFTIKQLAGDLLPNATIDDRIATAFHRNTQTNTEGGTDDEEFRIAAVLDRVNTTWQVWQGSTFGCTQCHTHPYDPFKHEDYYKFVALLNNSRDSDIDQELPKVWTPEDAADQAKAEAEDREIARLKQEIHAPIRKLADDQSQWKNIRFQDVQSTGYTELFVREADGVSEVMAQGTLSAGSRYTLDGVAPAGIRTATALRIDSLPIDLEAALRIPEMGFVLSRLRLEVLQPGEEKYREVNFQAAYSDEADPLFDPQESLEDTSKGWSAYTRMYRPRHAVFILSEPLELTEETKIRLKLKQSRSATGSIALLIERGRYWLSGDARWMQLMESKELTAQRESLAQKIEARKKRGAVGVPVMAERAREQRRRTFMFNRGNWLDRGEEVQPNTPSVMPTMKVEGDWADRLDMARWLVSGENPLTSRAMVNRLWGEVFGIGIVETAEDLGASGETPTHPQLLDDLSVRFQDDYDWSIKRLLREMVLSATYRQDSRASAEEIAEDPRNRLLARGPRRRLRAEMVRDQALMLSGKFSDKMYGKPVMPYQPEGIWQSVYSGSSWETSSGDDRYRRAIYTYWKRTSGYPSMITFDMPSREVCTVRRIPTNTPLQALVTLNDPTYIDLASGFAERMAQAATEPDAQIAWAYRQATGRQAPDSVGKALEELYTTAVAEFEADANDLAEEPEGFGLTIVANAILNLDETLTK